MQKFSSGVKKRKNRGRNEYIAWLAYYDIDGTRKWKYRSAPSPSKAKELKQELEKKLLTGGGTAVQSDSKTFVELLEHCRTQIYCKAEYCSDGSTRTLGVTDTSVYQAHLKHFKEFFGKIRLRDVDVSHLRAYRLKRLRTKTKRGTNVNVSTVNREMNTLKAMFTEARILKWILVNPFSEAKRGDLIRTRDEKKRKVTLSYDQEVRLLAACEGERLEDRRHLRALLIVALDSGARFGELIKLKKAQLRYDEGVGVIKDFMNEKGKDGSPLDRDMVMTKRVREVLLDLERNPPKKAFRQNKSGVKPSEDLVFGISDNIRTSWAGACEDAGLSHLGLHFHDLRHSAGTRLAEVLQIVEVGKVLGHSNPKTTERYINPGSELLERAAAVLEQWQEQQRLLAMERTGIDSESDAVN
jgi:integrase